MVCYGIVSLWDMNRKTGATQIVPGSHTPENVAHIQSYRNEKNVDWEGMSDLEQRHYVPTPGGTSKYFNLPLFLVYSYDIFILGV